MNCEVLSKIAVKILALYLIAQGIMQLPSISIVFQSIGTSFENDTQTVLLIAAATGAPLMVGILAWFFSERISKFVLKDIETTDSEPVQFAYIQAIALASVGLIILVHALPNLINATYQIIDAVKPENEELRLNSYQVPYFLASLAKVILAASLILGVSGWVKLIHKLRGAGLQ